MENPEDGERAELTDSILALGGHEKELTGHTKGALRNGLTEEEIREAVSHHCGRWPPLASADPR